MVSRTKQAVLRFRIMVRNTRNPFVSRLGRIAVQAYMALLLCGSVVPVSAAGEEFSTTNFAVRADSADVARRIALLAEEHRATFAHEWLRLELPDWKTPCQIVVEERLVGGQGALSYRISQNSVTGLRIVLTGRLDQVLEYVLPHEVAHAVLATVSSRPLPRWADEGVALLFEPERQRARQRKAASRLAAHDQMMPLTDILRLTDYPDDPTQLVEFYASAYSLTEYLVNRGGKERLIQFVHDGERHGWGESARLHYDVADIHSLEQSWKQWAVGELNAPSITVATAKVEPDADPGQ